MGPARFAKVVRALSGLGKACALPRNIVLDNGTAFTVTRTHFLGRSGLEFRAITAVCCLGRRALGAGLARISVIQARPLHERPVSVESAPAFSDTARASCRAPGAAVGSGRPALNHPGFSGDSFS